MYHHQNDFLGSLSKDEGGVGGSGGGGGGGGGSELSFGEEIS